jgi:hypothetical protein
MHNWTRVWGYTASMASGKPPRPSTHAMKMSLTPRFCTSVKTCSQNMAPSVWAIHMRNRVFLSGYVNRQHEIESIIPHMLVLAHMDAAFNPHRQSGREAPKDGSAIAEPRPSLPLSRLRSALVTRLLASRSCSCAWMSRVVMPRAYKARIFSSKRSKRVCPYLDQLRLEHALSVTRHLDVHVPLLSFQGFLAMSIAAVARRLTFATMFGVAQVRLQFRFQATFDHRDTAGLSADHLLLGSLGGSRTL